MEDYTRKFNAAKEKDEEIHHILTSVYTALEEKGYNPINQLVGYILSEDPTYITNHRQARTLMPSSSRSSRQRACSAVSPGSSLPPGNSQ